MSNRNSLSQANTLNEVETNQQPQSNPYLFSKYKKMIISDIQSSVSTIQVRIDILDKLLTQCVLVGNEFANVSDIWQMFLDSGSQNADDGVEVNNEGEGEDVPSFNNRSKGQRELEESGSNDDMLVD